MSKNPRQQPKIFYQSIPKVELHRHLEGSLRFDTMIEIARDFDLDVPYRDTEKLRSMLQVQDGDPFTHQNFLSKFQSLRLFYQTPEVISRLAREVVADAAADGIRYMEVRFTPVALTRIKDFSLGDAMKWVIASTKEAAEEYGVNTRLIASTNRHESVELASEVIHLAIDYKDDGIVGIDLAGDEANFPGDPFAGIVKEAKQAGLHVTIHAGEWSGADNVIEAIETLDAERIGHGVRVLEDPNAVALAREKHVTFEVCPTSNYQSGVVPSLNEHPLHQMIKEGLDATINTDDPSISQIVLSDEYELACEGLGFTLQELRESILNAARASFLEEDERQELVESLAKDFADWPTNNSKD